MDYIYIDESGELAKQTDYFVFGAIITNAPKEIDNLIKKTRKNYKKQLGNISEIKGYTTDDYILKKILKKLNNTDCRVVGIILDKKNIYKVRHSYDYNILYDTLASKLAQEISINNSTSIIVDKCKNKKEEINNFNKQFTSNLNNSKNHSVDIKHANSIHYSGLQMADIMAWSIFQSVERDNSEFIDLIQNKTIKRVYEE
ncbi:MAG: DUF3800 domain-containing protein [Methanobrevibacter sp.]|uniref:DUF3800 domain-containing protein n=1 Tax=Methanobrevibacter sp. TaxID=66852 RepID=UPI0025E43E60|nr:DUF3800 domain-containing protein [Methanobrevibacter sp.]MBQ6099845.1 DUF3800 domain-containing protein [Methanobrevibacter sp.]